MSNVLYPSQKKYLESFIPAKDKLITDLENFAKENRVPILDKLSAEFLEQMVLMTNPKNVLEIGTAIAYSSIRIARLLGEKGKLITLEKSKPNLKLATANIKQAGLQDKIEICFGDALDIMPRLKQKFDFVFLDADKQDYMKLFDLSIPLIKKNGVIFIDNLMWYGYAAKKTVPKKFRNSTRHIREFNEYFMKHPSLKTSLQPIGDGIGIGIKL